MCQNCDLDRLIQALQENYLYIRFRDNNFESVSFIIQNKKVYKTLKIKNFYLICLKNIK